MGQITEYAAMGAAPAVADKLFIADADATTAFEIKSITIANLNKMADLAADTVSGLSIKDSGGNYGIFIKNGGNVGVGTGSPSYELDAQASGDITFRIQGGASNDAVMRIDQAGTQRATIGYDHSSTLLKVNNSSNFGGSNHLVVDVYGRVGINTSSPTDYLEIKGDAVFLQMNFPTNTSYTGIKLAEGGTAKGYVRFMGSNYTTAARRNMLELASTAGISFWPDNGAADVVINTAGNLGVGTTSPAALVHIEGTANVLYLNASSGNCSMRLSNS